MPVPLSLQGRPVVHWEAGRAVGSDAEVGSEQQEPWRRQRLRTRRATPARAADPGATGAGLDEVKAARAASSTSTRRTRGALLRPTEARAGGSSATAVQAQSLAARRLLIFGVARFVARNGVNAGGLVVHGEPLDVRGWTR